MYDGTLAGIGVRIRDIGIRKMLLQSRYRIVCLVIFLARYNEIFYILTIFYYSGMKSVLNRP